MTGTFHIGLHVLASVQIWFPRGGRGDLRYLNNRPLSYILKLSLIILDPTNKRNSITNRLYLTMVIMKTDHMEGDQIYLAHGL